MADLTASIDAARFQSTFGASPGELSALVAAKTVSIQKLMAIAPPGTRDPSSTVYNSTMFVMVVLLGIALIANRLVRPVNATHHLKDE